MRSHKVQFGIHRLPDAQKKKPQLSIASVIEQQSCWIYLYEGDEKELLAARSLPDGPKLTKLAIDLDTQTRTVRFFLDGDPLHDDDIPIPWTVEVLREMTFSVQLFEPGDCVRIID